MQTLGRSACGIHSNTTGVSFVALTNLRAHSTFCERNQFHADCMEPMGICYMAFSANGNMLQTNVWCRAMRPAGASRS